MHHCNQTTRTGGSCKPLKRASLDVSARVHFERSPPRTFGFHYTLRGTRARMKRDLVNLVAREVATDRRQRAELGADARASSAAFNRKPNTNE